MIHFPETILPVPLLVQQTITSVAATDIINMDTYDTVTILMTTATITSGGNVTVRQMDAVTDTVSAESTLNLDCYWEQAGAANDTYTKNASADSISSVRGITIANADDSRIYVFEIRGEMLSSSNNCIALYFESSGFNGAVEVTALCHNSRYKQSVQPTALA